ncbi:Myosin-binding protein 3 [Zea mays]|uniref:Myosin-binding protein 3 n=1 Tax=Zea mays TaxID=4577 RepID=A0A1D6GJM3_MAIZE|nr:Myosin-binding protein 3 [Zea mays]
MVSQAPMAGAGAGAGANLTAALCRKSNRVARVLAYALLEWVLIALLLADGVFSYLISRFAAFFGLAPPCALCSRLGVDSLFETHPRHRGVGAEPLRRLLCDVHAAELSRVGYCSAHRRLADAGDMCEDCAAAAAAAPGKALLSWMGQSELGERDLACACCGVALESGFYSPPFLLTASAPRGSDCGHKEEEEAARPNGDVVFVSEEGPVIELFDEKPFVEGDSIGVLACGAEVVANVERLVPLESIDSLPVAMATMLSQSVEASEHVTVTQIEEKQVQQAEVTQELDSLPICSREQAEVTQAGLEQDCGSVPIDSGEHGCLTSYAHTDVEQAEVKQKVTSVTRDVLDYAAGTFNVNTNTWKEDIEEDPTEAALTAIYQISYEPLTNLDKFSPDHSVSEEDRQLNALTHIEDICDSQEPLDSKAAVSDAKSVDSGVATLSTDLESTELVNADQLKSALASTRKSLNTLYFELENERNAAAIAADETMAMINRLQEQKAAMQMEAIQYQRLMEEQSEYDQEALERLNELVVKREKEKQDLERELELYRHKVHLYEIKVRKMSRHKADDQNGSSSTSSSAEDSDDLSQSFYEGDESSHGLNGSNGSIPTDVVLQETARHLVIIDGSLADFEEERLSILEQLKVLEDKLFDLDDDDESDSRKHFPEENHFSGASNGFSDDDSCSKLRDKRRVVTYRGKELLPLFDDATTVEAGNVPNGDEAHHPAEATLDLARERHKLVIANEIDQVNERLQALEADREYIKQCVRALKRGGEGFDLLQEILQHLRDLRRIEQRGRNSGELSPHYLHLYTD